MRFGGENFAEKNRIELRNRRRSSGESLTDLNIDIRRLSALAYPDADHRMRELISCDYFIDALAELELGLKIRERQPKDLDSALRIALQLEVWAKDSERLSQTIGNAQIEGRKVHEFTQLESRLNLVSEVANETEEQRKLIAEQNKLMSNFQQTVESMNVYLQSVHSGDTGNRSGHGLRMPVSCYHCSQPGHIARNHSLSGSYKLLYKRCV